MESDQELMRIKKYYAEKGLNSEVLSNLAPGFLLFLGVGAELDQNEEE